MKNPNIVKPLDDKSFNFNENKFFNIFTTYDNKTYILKFQIEQYKPSVEFIKFTDTLQLDPTETHSYVLQKIKHIYILLKIQIHQ